MNLRVLKFGGSSFRTLDDFRAVAALVARLTRGGDCRIVVVVSAMYGDTDRLLRAGLALAPNMSASARDALITTGELVSVPLLRVALESIGARAVSLTAHQCGIVTDSNFTQAAIRRVDTRPLRRALQEYEVVVVPGAQGVDGLGRITMLGRNSSDLTAVALGSALDVGECEILSDVAGVYSGDPYVIPGARLLPAISHRQLVDMSIAGAKVIHHGASAYARDAKCRILCRATRDPDVVGTVVDPAAPPVPVVVLHERARYLVYASREQARQVQQRLERRRTCGTVLDHRGSGVLVYSQADLVPQEELTIDGTVPRPLEGATLVTAFLHRRVERALVPSDSARRFAAYLHDRLCLPALEPVAAPAVPHLALGAAAAATHEPLVGHPSW